MAVIGVFGGGRCRVQQALHAINSFAKTLYTVDLIPVIMQFHKVMKKITQCAVFSKNAIHHLTGNILKLHGNHAFHG